MPKGDNDTKKQHFIPQCYLRNFSKDKVHIYQFDVLSQKQISKSVPIETICYEKNMYEYKDKNGNFICRNLIEKVLGQFEGRFANVFQSIKAKAHILNGKTLSFLSLNEKAFLIIFLATLIVRNPNVLQEGTNLAIEILGDNITKNEARNIALKTCLPFDKELDVKDKNLLNPIMKIFEDMSFQVGLTNKELLWTSDSPVILYRSNREEYIDNYEMKADEVIIPLFPNIALLMRPFEKTRHDMYNRLVKLETEKIKEINYSMATHCERWIYSKTPLTEKQIKWIKKERSKI